MSAGKKEKKKEGGLVYWAESGERPLLVLLKYPFYPLFNFDNGMNLSRRVIDDKTMNKMLARVVWIFFYFLSFIFSMCASLCVRSNFLFYLFQHVCNSLSFVSSS